MKIYKTFLIYGVLFIIVYISVYDFFSEKDFNVVQKDILRTEMEPFLKRLLPVKPSDSFSYVWLGKYTATEEQGVGSTREQQDTDTIRRKGDDLICINKQCFRFLAIIQKNKLDYAVFYAKTFPHDHIKLFEPNSQLYGTLYIKDVYANRVVLSEKNTTDNWVFEFFDVNITQYKPKDTNETLR